MCKALNDEEHKKRHEKLHKLLDELVSDFLTITGKNLSDSTVMELMEWSNGQTIRPENL